MNENEIGISCDLKNRERDSVLLTSGMNNRDGFWSNTKVECSMVEDNFTEGDEIEARNSVTLSSIPSSKLKSFEKNADFYTDKNVTECEFQELTVCYNESIYHGVKDICIDDGVLSREKILIESSKDEHNTDCNFLPSDGEMKDNITKQGVETELVTSNGLKASEKDCNNEATHECGTEEIMNIVLPSQDRILDESSKDEPKSGCIILPCDEDNSKLLIQEWVKSSEKDCKNNSTSEFGSKEKVDFELFTPGGLQSSSVNHYGMDSAKECSLKDLIRIDDAICSVIDSIVDDVLREKCVGNSMLLVQEFNKQNSPKSLLESSDHGGNEVEQQPAQIPCLEGVSGRPAVVSAPEESNKLRPAKGLIYNSKVENGTITFDFDSSTIAAAKSKIKKENIDCECPLKSQNVPKDMAGISDIRLVTNHTGESSFSAASLVSNRIPGLLPYSGSISLRSDSSTTSTRSFAFPILQSEWNISPVRMGKADLRHHRKHGGWRQGLFCCRF